MFYESKLSNFSETQIFNDYNAIQMRYLVAFHSYEMPKSNAVFENYAPGMFAIRMFQKHIAVGNFKNVSK